MISLIISLLALAGAGWVIYDFVSAYLTYSGDRETRFLFAFKSSLTLIWARFTLVVGLATTALVNGADFVGLPAVGTALQAWMTPTTVSLVFAVVAVVTEVARRRTL